MVPTPVFLPGESYGQRSLVGYSPQGCKGLDMTEVTENALPLYGFRSLAALALQYCNGMPPPSLCYFFPLYLLVPNLLT